MNEFFINQVANKKYSLLSLSIKMEKSGIIEKFNKLLEKNDSDAINRYFVSKCYSCNLEEIKYMVDNGADPRYNNDQPFVELCRSPCISIPLYFLKEYGADINAQNGQALENACYCNNYDLIDILIRNGIFITNDAIKLAINTDAYESLNVFIASGVNPQIVADLLFVRIFYPNYEEYGIPSQEFIYSTVLFLRENGIDFNKTVDNVLKKRYCST